MRGLATKWVVTRTGTNALAGTSGQSSTLVSLSTATFSGVKAFGTNMGTKQDLGMKAAKGLPGVLARWLSHSGSSGARRVFSSTSTSSHSVKATASKETRRGMTAYAGTNKSHNQVATRTGTMADSSGNKVGGSIPLSNAEEGELSAEMVVPTGTVLHSTFWLVLI